VASAVDQLAVLHDQIASAFTRVESRWEIITTVRPTAIRDRLRMKMLSLSGSSALAASSKIKILGLARRERAMDRRCFWPPDKLAAFSSSSVS
jgi:hypothetical protein